MAQATIFYPNNTLQIPLNIKDRVAVTYGTLWPATNLTLLCRASTSSVFDFYNVPDNPLQQSGTYLAPTFHNMSLNVQDFPALCTWRLTKYGNISINADGATFNLVNDPLPTGRTFGISSTIGLSTSTSTSSPSTSTSSATQIPQSSASVNAPGMSTGTSVAVGVSCVLGFLLLVSGAVMWVLYSRKRQKRRSKILSISPYDKAELHASPSPNLNHINELYGSQCNNGAMEKHGTPLIEKDASSNITEMAVPGPQALNRSDLSEPRRGTKRHELA